MKPPSTTLELELPGGRLAVVTVTIREEAMPVPLESPHARPPTVHEVDEVADALKRRAWDRL